MIERAYLHVTGPKGAGKTTLVESIVRSYDGLTIAVRCERDDRLNEAHESKNVRDPEVRRYREAGATGAARLRFPSGDDYGDSFFCSDVMRDYSNAVDIEGDCPLDYVDLEVFVAPPLSAGRPLVERKKRREWTTAEGLGGIERAALVVVNVRAGDDRDAAEAMLPQIARLRTDDAIRADVLGRFAHRMPITAVVADLSNPRDAGTKKALARIERVIAQRVADD